jgi:hypothetical protein
VSDEEVQFGITHNDHMSTEEWRVEQVKRIERAPNMDPYYDRKSRYTAANFLWWLLPFAFVVVFVAAVIGSIR